MFRPLLLALAIATPAFAADGVKPLQITANQGVGHAALNQAKATKPVKVLAALPITYGLAQVLLKGTDVQLERAAPANLPGSRQVAYFTGRGAQALNTLALDADAAIGLRSLWPDDPLYPVARRSNIRIVEVDAARPVDGMHADLADYAKGATGRVCLYANSSAMSQELPRQLTQWNTLHPGIRLDIREERSREILQAVREGVADVGIVTTRPSEELRFEPYCQDRLCLLVPNDHPLKMRHARFEDLLGYDFVGLEDNAAITPLITEAAAAIGMPLRLRVQVRSFEAVCRLIAAGQGVGVLPQGAVQIFRKEMALRFIEIDDSWADRQMYLCMRKEQPSLTSLALFDYLSANPA